VPELAGSGISATFGPRGGAVAHVVAVSSHAPWTACSAPASGDAFLTQRRRVADWISAPPGKPATAKRIRPRSTGDPSASIADAVPKFAVGAELRMDVSATAPNVRLPDAGVEEAVGVAVVVPVAVVVDVTVAVAVAEAVDHVTTSSGRLVEACREA
jgi:hypothetical protein